VIRYINPRPLFILFLLSPILSLFIALRSKAYDVSRNLIWFFCSFTGYNFVFGNAESDINRYRDKFISYSNSDLSVAEFLEYLFNESFFDFIQPLISFVTAQFTDNFRIFLLIIGTIYGFFLSRNVFLILSWPKTKINSYNVIFIVIFSLIYAFWDINVMRFTLAAHIFFYGWSLINIKNNNIGYVFKVLAVFVHFSFTLMFLLTIIYKLLGSKFINIYFIFFLVSIVYSSLTVNVFNDSISLIPQAYQSRSEDYLKEDYVEFRGELQKEKNFRAKFYQDSIRYAVYALVIFVFFIRKRFHDKTHILYLLGFSLLCLGVFNFLVVIPSMNRFLFFTYLFAFLMFYLIFQGKLTFKDKVPIVSVYPLLLFYLMMKVRVGFEFTGLITYFGSPIMSFFIEDNTPMLDYIK